MRNGEVVAGYSIVRPLGAGGTGAVYLAQPPRSGQYLALKLLHARLTSPELARGFERETEIVAHLNHPHIVRMLDRGVESGTPWIAMDYIAGHRSAASPGLLPPAHAAAIAIQLAGALDYAHAHAVLHRDVKPANVMLERTAPGTAPQAYLSDFGMARLRSETMHLTQTAAATATLAFYSPEQLRGMEPDERSDQYSLACTAYWLLTGRPPFDSHEQTAIMHGHLNSPVPRVSSFRRGLPMELDEVFAQAMAKQPGDRFFSCTDFATALQRALPAEMVAPEAVTAPTPVQIAPSPRAPGQRRTGWTLLLLALLLLISVAAAAFIVAQRYSEPAVSATKRDPAAADEPAVPQAGHCVAGRGIGVVGPVRIIDCAQPAATLTVVRTDLSAPGRGNLECAGIQIKIVTVPTERNPAAQSCAVITLRDGTCYTAMSIKSGFEYDPACTGPGAARLSHRIPGRADTGLCKTYPPHDTAAVQEYARIEHMHFTDPAGPATYCFKPGNR